MPTKAVGMRLTVDELHGYLTTPTGHAFTITDGTKLNLPLPNLRIGSRAITSLLFKTILRLFCTIVSLFHMM